MRDIANPFFTACMASLEVRKSGWQRAGKRMNATVLFPILMDDIADPTATRWGGWPIRMFVVKQDGTVGYTSINGPFGFRPDATFLHGDGLPATNNADRGYNQESLATYLETLVGDKTK